MVSTDENIPPPPPPPPPPVKTAEMVKVAEELPRFPSAKCINLDGSSKEKKACADKAMLIYVYENLQYPKEAKEAGIEGTVVVQFTVKKDGSLADIKIVRDIGGGCGVEAKRIIESMNAMSEKWIPGRARQKPVEITYNLPIKFSLD